MEHFLSLINVYSLFNYQFIHIKKLHDWARFAILMYAINSFELREIYFIATKERLSWFLSQFTFAKVNNTHNTTEKLGRGGVVTGNITLL